MRLEPWQEAHQFSDAQLAEMVGVDRSAIYRWKHGARPAKKYILKIFSITGGKVTPSDFYDLPRLVPKEILVPKEEEEPVK